LESQARGEKDMTITPINDSRDIEEVDPKLEYRALVNSLTLTQGFGLVFVQCSPSEGERLIAKVRKNLPEKQIQVLSLTEPTDTLFDKVEVLYQSQPTDVLFIQGIEHSLFQYERSRLWQDDAQRLNYSETGVPRLLQHLNLNREKFQEHFPIHFVFLVPHFALKYLIRRAPDFCDWNSGIFELPMEPRELLFETMEATHERLRKDDPQNLTPEECRNDLLEIQALMEEPHQTQERKAELLFEQARLFEISGLNEEAINSYNKALKIKSDYHEAWNNRGFALNELGRYEEAVTSYDKALEFKPHCYEAWDNRGAALGYLGRYEEAISSYDKALEFKPDCYKAWDKRGIALGYLGRYEEAISSYDKALQIQPNVSNASNVFYNKACTYALQSNLEEVLENLGKAIALNPDKYREMAKIDSDFDAIREDERFQALVQGYAAAGMGRRGVESV
jgi:tetratricopeptide (TPR) repeat protein